MKSDNHKYKKLDLFLALKYIIPLSLLHYYKDESIHKDDVSEIVREYLPDANLDTQVRHLKRDGWEIEDPENRRGYFKLNPLKPSEVFIQKQHLDQIRINRPEFDEIKKIYDYRCATCGEREGEKHRFYKEIVKLEKGHKDPHVAKSKEDYIPQCQFCNKAYKDKVTFDEYGRVKSAANVELVKKAHESVKQKIKNWLNEHLKFFFNL
ncbi:MAG: hypothetical protein OXC92_01570 [Flavobacteriaceae bacterium]|nr:hypothetical protein [Flavobacteriaceae bacterium]